MYTPHTAEEIRKMLDAIGVMSMEDLLLDVPPSVRLRRKLNTGQPQSELEIRQMFRQLTGRNCNLEEYVSFLGAGSYDHYLPALIGPILFRSEYYTAYTPYQAEISQGMLQAIYEYQTAICELTGMEAANASLYDGASALAEAVLMLARIGKGRSEIVIARTIHPYYREVVRTYCQGLGLSLIEAGYVDGRVSPDEIRKSLTDNSAGLLLQYPNFFGIIEEIPELIEMARKKGIRVAVSVDPVALGVLRSPAEFGADIVVGEGQGMGNAMSFGGPYVGFFATRSEFIRQMPGRIVGVTHDRKGRKGYTLTLQTREQHIKRERATSNICTNESLNALASLFYMAALGKKGLAEVAAQSARKAHYLRTELGKLRNVSIPWTGSFFKEFTVRVSEAPESVNRRLIAEKIIGGLDLGKFYPELRGNMLFCVTEKRTRSEIDKLVSVISAGPNGKS